MNKLIFLLTLFCFLAACSNKNTEDAAVEKGVQSEQREDSKLIEQIDAMYLLPFAEKNEDGTVTFYIESRRNWKPANEHIPDSEHFRVQIFTKKGNLVWSSSEGKNFMQVIGKVQPEIAGEMHVYKQIWNGKDNSGIPVPEGEYKVVMTIPAKPIEYSTTMDYYWKGSDDE